jgi:hypothetical protein
VLDLGVEEKSSKIQKFVLEREFIEALKLLWLEK